MKKCVKDFLYIQEKMRNAISLNRHRLDKLIVMFTQSQKELEFFYIKNKKQKKEAYTLAIDQLYHLDTRLRDYILKKFLIRCKLYHSLAFFRWRYNFRQFPCEEDKEEAGVVLRELFADKVEFMKQHLDKANTFRKSITAAADKEASSVVAIEKKKAKIKQDSIHSSEGDDGLVMKEADKADNILLKMSVDTKFKVKTFDSVGWSDPTTNTYNKALKYLQLLSFDKALYDKDLLNSEAPPPCVFMPEKKMMEKIVQTVMKYSYEGRKICLSKFCDMELEKHAYMVE